jgi:diadenosine tetraphosphatase ApaH/serine/threonine PP2A family protein phosphatase
MFIGDVHGMSDELRALMIKLQPALGDTVVFVGDLMDRGPDSNGVVRMVREWSESASFTVVLVEGNHEDKHRRYRRNLTVRPEVAAEQAGRSPELADLTEELSEADVAFLDGAVMFHRVPEHNLLVVHGGIPGDMDEFPATLEEVAELGGKAKRRMQNILRTRFISSETGKFLKLGDNGKDDPFWADSYDGRFGHVVFGHEPFIDGPGLFPDSTGVDTGSVFGGRLTSLVVAESGERSIVAVPSQNGLLRLS